MNLFQSLAKELRETPPERRFAWLVHASFVAGTLPWFTISWRSEPFWRMASFDIPLGAMLSVCALAAVPRWRAAFERGAGWWAWIAGLLAAAALPLIAQAARWTPEGPTSLSLYTSMALASFWALCWIIPRGHVSESKALSPLAADWRAAARRFWIPLAIVWTALLLFAGHFNWPLIGCPEPGGIVFVAYALLVWDWRARLRCPRLAVVLCFLVFLALSSYWKCWNQGPGVLFHLLPEMAGLIQKILLRDASLLEFSSSNPSSNLYMYRLIGLTHPSYPFTYFSPVLFMLAAALGPRRPAGRVLGMAAAAAFSFFSMCSFWINYRTNIWNNPWPPSVILKAGGFTILLSALVVASWRSGAAIPRKSTPRMPARWRRLLGAAAMIYLAIAGALIVIRVRLDWERLAWERCKRARDASGNHELEKIMGMYFARNPSESEDANAQGSWAKRVLSSDPGLGECEPRALEVLRQIARLQVTHRAFLRPMNHFAWQRLGALHRELRSRIDDALIRDDLETAADLAGVALRAHRVLIASGWPGDYWNNFGDLLKRYEAILGRVPSLDEPPRRRALLDSIGQSLRLEGDDELNKGILFNDWIFADPKIQRAAPLSRLFLGESTFRWTRFRENWEATKFAWNLRWRTSNFMPENIAYYHLIWTQLRAANFHEKCGRFPANWKELSEETESNPGGDGPLEIFKAPFHQYLNGDFQLGQLRRGQAIQLPPEKAVNLEWTFSRVPLQSISIPYSWGESLRDILAKAESDRRAKIIQSYGK